MSEPGEDPDEYPDARPDAMALVRVLRARGAIRDGVSDDEVRALIEQAWARGPESKER